MTESATLAMAAKARELKLKGVDIISLSLGEPDFKTPKFIQEAAAIDIKSEKFFAYPPVAGYLDLKESLAKKLKEENGLESKAENIVVSAGAKQSIANAMLCLVDPGDEVIVFSPYWVSYVEIIKLAGGNPIFVEGTLENNFKATAAQLKSAITPKTKVVIYSSPCNPTGAVFSKTELTAIAEVLKDFPRIHIIADEIYEYINFTGAHFSIGTLPQVKDRTITVNGFSKGFAMTGWRVGYINAPVHIAKACEKIQGQFTSGISSISQRAAYAAVNGSRDEAKAMSAEYLRRRELVYDLLKELPGVKTDLPEGAFYFFPDVSSYFGKSYNGTVVKDSNDICMYLLAEANVSLVEGGAFGEPKCVRISYAASESDLREAVKRIKQALTKLS